MAIVGQGITAYPQPDDALNENSKNPVQNKVVAKEVNELKSAKAPAIYDTASGAIASFEDGADGMPIKALTVNVEPVQAGSGTPSPNNVRPISGWTGANIYREAAYNASANPIDTIPFPTPPGTVYGGTLDVLNERISVDWKRITFPASGDGWTYVSGGRTGDGQRSFAHLGIAATGIDAPFVSTTPVAGDNNGLCNVYPWVANTAYENGADGRAWVDSGLIRVILRSDNAPLNNKNDVMSYLQTLSYTIEVVYKLANPIVYDTAPQEEITTLFGANSIWADCGSVSVNYSADTKLYIQKINAPIGDNMTADAQIASGKYFIIGNTLYLSTALIPAGDTIIPGTNCTKTDLAAALNALNA